jgi:hypothetical protein
MAAPHLYWAQHTTTGQWVLEYELPVTAADWEPSRTPRGWVQR